MDSYNAGTAIGNYVLERKIGQGSSGYVWIAKEVEGKDDAVIKIIPNNGWRKSEFEREVETLGKLTHPNIIKLYDWMVKGKHGILVIELLDRDLLDFLDDYTINESEARMMFKQILAGIGHLHKNNTAHMDIKPENILIRGSDILKIADLGSTHTWDEGTSSIKSGKAGTSFYCAPEVKSGKPYLADKADIWSLGITLHVMMTGFWPYLGQTEKEVLSNAKLGKVDLADQFLSPKLMEFMMTMLQIDPEKRPDIPSLLQHEWFNTAPESNIVFTPRGDSGSDHTNSRYSATSFSNITDPEDAVGPGIQLPELSLEGLKSPRTCQMMTPRMNDVNGAQFEEGLIRPSPRNLNPGMKQTKLGKLIHNFRKGFGRK